MTSYDLEAYLCPANGKPLLLSSGENCVCVQCPDGWREQRKNALVEEFYVSDTAVGRGADTSDLWRPGNSYTGTFYVQYTKLPDGTLRYGADWAARQMSVGQVYHRVCTVIIFDYQGNQLKRDDDIHSDLVLVAHHDRKVFPSGVSVDDVLEFKWAGEERYFYGRGYGLVGWENLANKTGNYVISFNAAPMSPVPHAVPRPPFQEPPVPSTQYPAGRYALTRIPASFINIRAIPSTAGHDLGDLRKGDVVTLTGEALGDWVRVGTASGVNGWVSLQNGAVEFTPASTPTPEPTFRLKDPVGCASVISSKFGVPRDYGTHEGLDITRKHGDCTPLILNGHDGVVIDVSSDGPYGNHVVVSSGVGTQEYRCWYCHLAEMFVSKRQVVKTGAVIGVMGSSGNSSGLHLHLSVQKVGAPTPAGSPLASVINPEPLIEWS